MRAKWFLTTGCVLLGMLLFAALTACTRNDTQARVLTEKDTGSTVNIKKGDVLAVSLEGNITTGYNWEDASNGEIILQPISEPDFQPYSKKLGSPGRIILGFRAQKAGEQALKLIYHRSFEKNTEPAKTFEVKVTVQD